MHAIILAGGFGTRLRAAVSDVPKPLAPIGGRPFLAWMIGFLAKHGFTGITLSVHYEWRKIQDYFTACPPPIPVDYAVEETPLGTGGAIAFALAQQNVDTPVLILNGDSFIKADYAVLYARHCANGAALTIALSHVSDTGRYVKITEKDGILTSFAPGEPGTPGFINAGIYVVQPDLFSRWNMPAAFSFEKDFLPTRVDTLKPMAFHADDYFIDIGIPEDYARACTELPELFS